MQIFYYQYVVKRGLNAPWLSKMKKAIDSRGGEGNRTYNNKNATLPSILIMNNADEVTLPAKEGNNDDHPSWGDLIWSYPGKGSFLNNNHRTIWGGGQIGQNGTGNLNH